MVGLQKEAFRNSLAMVRLIFAPNAMKLGWMWRSAGPWLQAEISRARQVGNDSNRTNLQGVDNYTRPPIQRERDEEGCYGCAPSGGPTATPRATGLHSFAVEPRPPPHRRPARTTRAPATRTGPPPQSN